MRFSNVHGSHANLDKKEARFQKRSVLSHPLLKFPIAQRLVVGFLISALFSCTVLGALALQSHDLMSQESARSQNLLHGNKSLRSIQDQVLQALSTGNLQRVYTLEYPQEDLAYTNVMSTLLTFIQFNESLTSSIQNVTSIQENRLQLFTLLAITCALLGIGIIGWLISRTSMHRLQQMSRVFQVVEKGQLDARIPVVGRDEIAAVSIAVNSMLDTFEHDISERQRMEQTLRENEERYRTIVTNAPIILFAVDADGIFTLSEGQGLQLLGLQPGQVVGLSSFEVYADFPPILDQLRRSLAGESVSIINQVGDLYFDMHTRPLLKQEQQPAGLIGVATDISERVHTEHQMQHQARHDALTDLPNRVQMLEQVELAILENEEGVALLVMDLNRFKDINDTFGHQYGDQVLQQVGKRLSRIMGNSETVARLGGDEFAILLSSVDAVNTQCIAGRLLNALEEQFTIGEYVLHIDASLGAALYPTHGTDALTLLRRADVAMYTAKQAKQGYALYNINDDRYSPHRLALLGGIRHAIDDNELMLYYQPQSEITTHAIQGVEALVRWQHPTFGFVTPDQFIPLAEQTGLIGSLTHWVLETAIHQCKQWLDVGLHLCVSVNLSASNLQEVTLPETIAALLEHEGVPPASLRVEVTESAVMTDVECSLDVLTRISASGISISVDDYGTGYSSLAYLKRLPVDELKIDRAFVQYLTEVEADVAIVRSTIALAHSLGMKVVAEGVEDEATWDLLEAMECDMVQGYYLSRPLSVQKFELWLSDATKEAVVA